MASILLSCCLGGVLAGQQVDDIEVVLSSPIIPLPFRVPFDLNSPGALSTTQQALDETEEDVLPENTTCGDGIQGQTEACEFDFHCAVNQVCQSCECVQEVRPPMCGDGVVQGGEACEFSDQCGNNAACQGCSCVAVNTCSNYSLSVSGGGTLLVGETGSASAVTTCIDSGPSGEREREDLPGQGFLDFIMGVSVVYAAPNDEWTYIPTEGYAGLSYQGIQSLPSSDSPDCTSESYEFDVTGGTVTRIANTTGKSTSVECISPGSSNVRVRGICSGKYDFVSFTCVAPTCGNARVEGAETCDDGNLTAGDGCNGSCQIEAVCGNNKVETGEDCEPPGSDVCDTLCKAVVCGDGKTSGNEQCDDGNLRNGDGCSSTCSFESFCGNGSINPGEECDDGNTQSGDGCSSTCRSEQPVCGNNIKEGTEECDGTSTPANRQCDAQCRFVPVCGNGFIEGSEACDDGNQVLGDGCDSNCQVTVTLEDISCNAPSLCYLNGSGTYSGGCPSENPAACPSGKQLQCESAGSCTGFDQQCQGRCCRCVDIPIPVAVCGDGVVNQQSEKCDDGNTSNCDTCNNDCTIPVKTGCSLKCDEGNYEFRQTCQGNWVIGSSGQCVCSNCVTLSCFDA